MQQWFSPPQPYKDELLSSWITRVALSYHITPAELFSKHLIKYQAYKRDLDIAKFDSNFWNVLSHLSQLSVSALKNMQILDLEGKLQEKIHTNQRNRWIVASSGNLYPKKRKSKALRFCPLCLKEKGYYSKDSKLLFVNVCTQHQVYMKDACPKCNSLILPVRIEPPEKIHECFRCGHDLSKTAATRASALELEAVKFSRDVLSKNIFLNQKVQRSSIDYFTVLHLLIKNLHKLCPKDILFKKFKHDHSKKDISSPYLFGQSPDYLSQLIAVAYTLLTKEWDGELLKFLKRNKLMYASQLLNKRENVYFMIPDWFVYHMKLLWQSNQKLECLSR